MTSGRIPDYENFLVDILEEYHVYLDHLSFSDDGIKACWYFADIHDLRDSDCSVTFLEFNDTLSKMPRMYQIYKLSELIIENALKTQVMYDILTL